MQSRYILLLSIVAASVALQSLADVKAAFLANKIVGPGTFADIPFNPITTLTLEFGVPTNGVCVPFDKVSYNETGLLAPSPCISNYPMAVRVNNVLHRRPFLGRYVLVAIDPSAGQYSLVRHLIVPDVKIKRNGLAVNTTTAPVLFPFGPPEGSGAHQQPRDFKIPSGMDIFSKSVGDIINFNLTSFVQETKLESPIAATFLNVQYDTNNGSFCSSQFHFDANHTHNNTMDYRHARETSDYADNKLRQDVDHVSATANTEVAKDRFLDNNTRAKGGLNAAVDKVSEGVHAATAEFHKQKAIH
ncbi:glucose-repressible protein [Planoprotostelium fungivorum]|uniref:Glucose-repressible protein n=1 Tax=Planoprotostelium fungivorum TaxID=1890364 RepID=A0A2P6P0V1_9EUKA|nr:glucose-repressible protein [Planoprotostelium fungivorum]